jgi:hypothetical protein
MQGSELRLALRAIAHVLERGERDHVAGDWLDLPTRDHAAKAMSHLDHYLVGADVTEDHLVNAACRLLFCIELRQRQRESLQVLKEHVEERKAR